MFARIENNAVVEYPLTQHDIKARDPDRLFTSDFAACLPEGYVRVLPSTAPDSALSIVTETTPTLVDGQWVQTWNATDRYTPEELAAQDHVKTEQKWAVLRSQRDSALSDSSWVLERHAEEKLLGLPTSISEGQYMAWLTYRQQLRDFPSTVNDIDNYTLPTEPGVLGVA